jgi:starch-binding outer membrane protein, SusD/RagB family
MKYKFLYIIVIVSILFASCKKFLETDSPSSFTDTYVFSHTDDAKKAVLGIYALFNQDGYTSRISSNQNGNSDIEVGGVSSAPDNSRRDIWSFEATPSCSELLAPWNNAYNAINRANECIEGMRSSAIKDEPEIKQLLGEALTLRAYWYYLVLMHWGDIPYKTTATKAGDEFYLPRTDRDTILAHLIQDLIDIEPDMQWSTEVPEGIERINRDFTIGMIARLSLARAGYALRKDFTMRRSGDDYLKYYQIADTYCKKLMTLKPHSLSSDFGKPFRDECEWVVDQPSGEILYEVAFAAGSGDVGWNNGIRVDAGTHPYGSGSNYLSFPPTYFYSFDTLDKRLPVTCSLVYYDKNLDQQPVAYGSIAPGKWCRIWMTTPSGPQSAKGTGINWPLMRYTDILLMYAEAENELNNGPTEDAKDAIRTVRRRAFDQSLWSTKVEEYISNISVTKDAFFSAIVDERAWEFGGEFYRKFDLIRWNLYGKKIAEVKAKLTQMGADTYNGTGTYSYLPDYFYYKTDSTTGVVTIVNKFIKPALEPEGYTKVSWLRSLYNSTTGGPADYINNEWRGYKDNTGEAPVPYVLPIHNSIVTSSLGILNNDGYGFNF